MEYNKFDSEYYIIPYSNYVICNFRLQPEYAGLDRDLYVSKVPLKPFKEPIRLRKHVLPLERPYDHFLFGSHHVFSQRICDIIRSFNPVNIDFLPATVTVGRKEYTDYSVMHVYNIIECMDRDKSQWERNPRYNPETMPPKQEFRDITKFGLDEKILSTIPLQQRLIFEMRNVVFETFFHESIINEINKLKRPSLLFTAKKLNEWEGM